MCICLTCSFVSAAELETAAQNWPYWRGPQANGIASNANPPLTWGENTNIRWKTPIPGEGSGTPIVWGERVFIVTAIPTDRKASDPPAAHPESRTRAPDNFYQFVVFCLDRGTGKIRWRDVAVEAVPHEGRHTTNTYASGSPATDGERLYVSFGSRGIHVYDLEGHKLWSRDLGDMRTRRGWGETVTPAVHRESLIVNWDTEDESFIVALRAATGEVLWKKSRDEATSWTTPMITKFDGTTQVVVNGTTRVRSYDIATGALIWQCGGQTVNPIPTPVVHDGIVYCMSGYRGAAAYAIPLSAKGDVTDSETIRWSHHQATPYVPSPLVYKDQIYFTRGNSGILTSLAIRDGSTVFGPERVSGLDNVYASPVAAKDRIYFVSREGTTVVIEHGPELKILATNVLNEPIDASPALVGEQIFLRGQSHVYCIQQ